ncbi:hypothetical protein FGG08_004845 [Glutinoglossum americanum]|uniref:RBR-type E3 ubiquitin transferase n=1 Tax=Glutinoglossum americanum TaxID=1670608 RepID=A0A9P8I4F2_9PEZI|nr:hypothetical protein FGG08_004845 [Glutinoglossum americanum]
MPVRRRALRKIPAEVHQPLAESYARPISGSVVHFGTVLTVLSVKLPADFSAIQISQLPRSTSPNKIHRLLERSGFNLPISDIRMKVIDGFVVAEARVEDPSFAEKAIQSLNGIAFDDTRISVRRLQAGIGHGVLMNQLQNTSVICTWYKASRVAWAHYNSLSAAQRAATVMNGKKFMGRQLQCRVQLGTLMKKGAIHSVEIGNLPSLASEDALRRTFRYARAVILGPPSWKKPDEDAPDYIKTLLSQPGSLESFELSPVIHSTRTKAIARFRGAEDARKAVRDLNEMKLPELGQTKLFLTPLVVVKFNILTDIYEAVRGDLDDLKPQIWIEGHVNLKMYPPADKSPKRFTTLRLTGDDVKSVAKAKGQVDTALTGTPAIASDGTTLLWDELFTTPAGLQFLSELRNIHGVFLYRDLRKCQIKLYGPPGDKQKVQAALRRKLEDLSALTHTISLDSGWLSSALQGGFRSILSIFGKSAARLDILRKTLTIHGDQTACKTAEGILQNPSLNTTALEHQPGWEDKECSVCYTEPTDPYQAPCEHYYCRTCFAHQIASANRPEDFPITCIGSQGQCGKPLSFIELKRVLPPPDFESLLQAAFIAYIRAKPDEYQYCPTADCDQLYRTSGIDNGTVFDCPNCLNSICISCKVVNHEGSTCAEYRDLKSEGAVAFQRWKERNHVKPCPKCETPIEKESGCNHMTCTAAHADIY